MEPSASLHDSSKEQRCSATSRRIAKNVNSVTSSARGVGRARRRRRACTAMQGPLTLLACGWSFQNHLVGVECFGGMVGGVGGGASWTSDLRSSCARTSAAGWVRRHTTTTVLQRDEASGACPHVRASSTLDRQEEGGGAWLDEESSGGGNGDSDVGDGGGGSTTNGAASASNSRVMELLNGLEGGGAGGVEGSASEVAFGISAAAVELTAASELNGSQVSEGKLPAADGTGEDGESAAVDEEEDASSKQERQGVGQGQGMRLRHSRARDRRRLRPLPLTKSQAEEQSLQPMVQAINTLRKDRETRDWQQVMDIMGRVKEEHGARGLGLSHVYQIGIGACVDFARPAEALQLFDEVRTYPESPPTKQCYDLAIVSHCMLKERDEALRTMRGMREVGYEPTEPTYVHILHACRGTDSGVAIADRLVEQHVAERRQPGALPRYLPLCQSYLLVLATADQWERSVELLWDLVERGDPAPDAACYDAALLACRRSGRWREAQQLFNHIRREDVQAQPTDATYMQAIMTMLVEDESDEPVTAALKAFGEMRRLGIFDTLRPSGMSTILRAVFKECVPWEKHWPTAMSVFETMKENDIAPSAAEYRSMLHMLSLIPGKEEKKGENWEQSLALLREAQDLELRLTEVSFNTVIADLGHAGEVDLAFGVFDDMRQAGIPPSLNTYNRLLGVCEKNGEVDRTFKVLDEMYKGNLPPTVVSFGSAISACGKGMEWRKALALLVRMQHDDIQPNLHCMNAAINAVGLSGEWRRAEALMEVIHKSGLQPDLISYNSIAMAYASAGESDRAMQVLDTMRENGLDPDAITYGTLLTACEGEDASSTMRMLLDEMDRTGVEKSVIHYSAAIESANRMRETHVSWELWRLMNVNGIEANNHAYSSIINTAALDRDVRGALKLLEEMEKKEMEIDVVTYTTAICACGPDWLLALDVLEEMADAGVPPNLMSYTATMGSCLAGEEYREAINVFARMKASGIEPDLRAYNLAIVANEKAGDVVGRETMEAEMQMANLQRPEWTPEW